MWVVVAGRPRAGKTTQCLCVAPQLRMACISTQDLLCEAVTTETPLGVNARDHLIVGRPVPDRLVTRLVESRLAGGGDHGRGFLLDGFPRTIGQARALFEVLAPAQLDLVIELVVPVIEVLQRRLGHPRDEDEAAVSNRRLHLYERQTVPMLRWLRSRVPVVRVDAARPQATVSADLLRVIGVRPTPRRGDIEVVSAKHHRSSWSAPQAPRATIRGPWNMEARARGRRRTMGVCEVCHNDYDKTFQVVMNNEAHTFDSFECALHALAPVCASCGCRVIGHGVEAEGRLFCSASCAQSTGITGLRDRL
jgi:adenylate kinase family enzyme